jgi:hypothetical protein
MVNHVEECLLLIPPRPLSFGFQLTQWLGIILAGYHNFLDHLI